MNHSSLQSSTFIECNATTWGEDCGLNCSSQCLDKDCDAMTGMCKDCVPGYHGDRCDRGKPFCLARFDIFSTELIFLLLRGLDTYTHTNICSGEIISILIRSNVLVLKVKYYPQDFSVATATAAVVENNTKLGVLF